MSLHKTGLRVIGLVCVLRIQQASAVNSKMMSGVSLIATGCMISFSGVKVIGQNNSMVDLGSQALKYDTQKMDFLFKPIWIFPPLIALTGSLCAIQ